MNLAIEVQKYLDDDSNKLSALEAYYKSLLSFESVIQNASEGIMNHDGKMNPHQWRIGKKRGALGAKELLKQIDCLMVSKSFEDIFLITEQVKKTIHGLGDLWSYDTALRIGFNIGVYPLEVYVQRGVIAGVRKALNDKRSLGRSIPLDILPEAIKTSMKPYQAENFLCIFGKDSKINFC